MPAPRPRQCPVTPGVTGHWRAGVARAWRGRGAGMSCDPRGAPNCDALGRTAAGAAGDSPTQRLDPDAPRRPQGRGWSAACVGGGCCSRGAGDLSRGRVAPTRADLQYLPHPPSDFSKIVPSYWSGGAEPARGMRISCVGGGCRWAGLSSLYGHRSALFRNTEKGDAMPQHCAFQ
eukprot:gene15007-biopygen3638